MMSESVAVATRMRAGSVATYAPAFVWLSVLGLGVLLEATMSTLTAPMLGAMALAIAIQVGAAIAFFPLARTTLALIVAALVIALAPFVIPSSARPLRFVTACASVILVMKLWDLHARESSKICERDCSAVLPASRRSLPSSPCPGARSLSSSSTR